MGKLFLKFDPAGYQRCVEPGFSVEWKGSRLRNDFYRPQSDGIVSTAKDTFFNPPGSEWLMPVPRQWDPHWYKDSRLSQHVLRMDHWTWSPQVHPVEFEPTKRPVGTNYPANQWISITMPLDGVTSLDSTNYDALMQAITGVSGEGDDLRTIAMAHYTPSGVELLGAFTPYVKFDQKPRPDDVFILGWSKFALVCTADSTTLLQSPNNDKQTWQSCGGWSPTGGSARWTDWTDWGKVLKEQLTTYHRERAVVPVGPNHLYLFAEDGKQVAARTSDIKIDQVIASAYPNGPWWIGTTAGRRLHFQVQIMGYEVAESNDISGPLLAVGKKFRMFDLGSSYQPTRDLSVTVGNVLHPPTDQPLITATSSDSGATTTISSSGSGEQIIVAVKDLTGNAWVSDGTRSAGYVRLRLQPSTTDEFGGSAGYVAPQLARVIFDFPAKQAPRANSPLTLGDEHFLCHWEASLEEPDGKRFTITLYDKGEALLVASGFDKRTSYPIELWEDTNADNVPDVRRAAGWVRDPDAEQATVGAVAGSGLTRHTIEGKGLASRLDCLWSYLPSIVDTQGGGFVEHNVAVSRTLERTGFDPTDAATVFIALDEYRGTDITRLPGTFGDLLPEPGQSIDQPWSPDWGEKRLQYIERIATQWRGWLFYEQLDGRLNYHYNPLLAFQLRYHYYVSATIYRTSAAAEAAGAPAAQIYEKLVSRVIEPEGNSIRVIGKDAKIEGLVPTALIRDLDSLADPSKIDTFLGEEKVVSLVSKLAVTPRALNIIASVKLLTARLRRFTVTWETKLAPWQIGEGLDVGRVVTLEGQGDYVIAHVELEFVRRDTYVSRVTGIRVPQGATATATPGSWPGQGIVAPS